MWWIAHFVKKFYLICFSLIDALVMIGNVYFYKIHSMGEVKLKRGIDDQFSDDEDMDTYSICEDCLHGMQCIKVSFVLFI